MWLALVLWERRPSAVAAALFGIAGVGVFLTWPVWIGPPVLVLVGLAVTRGGGPRATRWCYLAAALGPIALVAALHAAGRGESVAIVQTGGAAFWPSAARVGVPLLLLATAGIVAALRSGSGRVTVVLLAAIALQGLALFVVARVSGADSPYMALKMPHLAIYPMAVLAALALASGWRLFERVVAAAVPDRSLPRVWASVLVWLLVGGGAVWTAARFASVPQPEPAITENMFRAGHWARDHVPTNCIEYLVKQDATSYWLHQAVLRNPMQPPPGVAPPVFVYREALVRWITGASFPVTIADFSLVPREVREDVDVLARFGRIAVGRRRGTSGCSGG